MPLVELPLQLSDEALPNRVIDFIEDAENRIEEFRLEEGERIPGFVSCNFHAAYRALREIAAPRLKQPVTFCEWGSGFGVVTCLARMLGFDACGIELEPNLIVAARTLARHWSLDVTYFQGSYKPAGIYRDQIDEETLHQPLGFRPMDFNVIFVYPWPAEERIVAMLVERYARHGTLLMTYHGGGRVLLRRKIE